MVLCLSSKAGTKQQTFKGMAVARAFGWLFDTQHAVLLHTGKQAHAVLSAHSFPAPIAFLVMMEVLAV